MTAVLVDFYSGKRVNESFIRSENKALKFCMERYGAAQHELAREKYIFCQGQSDDFRREI